MAGAILMLLDPKRYGAIDIRVWRLLHEERAVTGRTSGIKLTPDDWVAS